MKMFKFIEKKIKLHILFIRYLAARFTGRVFVDREKDYWGYIAAAKKTNCRHKEIVKLAATKYYCKNCGIKLRYIREELAIISELAALCVAAFFLIKFLNKSKK